MEPKVGDWRPIPGETPIDPSYLKDRSITTRLESVSGGSLEHPKGPRQVFGGHAHETARAVRLRLAASPSQGNVPRRMAMGGPAASGGLEHGRSLAPGFRQVLALTEDLSCWDQSGMCSLEQATRLHHRAVWIHPFMNGNGRWARLLANIWLRVHKAPRSSGPTKASGKRA